MRRFGYIPDKHDSRDRLFAAPHKAAGVSRPSEIAHWRHIPRSRSQGNTSSCVGHGVIGDAELRRIMDGKLDVPLSPAHCYANSRLQHLLPGERLSDSGTFIRTAMRAVHKLGVAHERVCPLNEASINRRPGPEADEDGIEFAGGAYHRIPGTGVELLENILDALVVGGVVVGEQVTRRFMEHVGEGVLVPPASYEPFEGGHCTYLAGYREGGTVLYKQNSWLDWGFSREYITEDGIHRRIDSCSWVAAEWVLSRGFGDAWMFEPAGVS